MPKFTSMPDAIAHNQQAFCNVPECFVHRHGVSSYCLKHRSIHAKFGHPLQSSFNDSLHAAERQQVIDIFHSNPDHPGIASAVQWLQQWVDQAIRGSAEALAAEDLRRLVDHDITAKDILIEAASFHLFQQWNPHKFLNDAAVDIALSLAVLKLAPMERLIKYKADGTETRAYKRPKTAPRKKVGRHIRSHLMDLFTNLQRTIESNRSAALTTREAMRSPLIFPAVLIQAKDQSGPPW